MKNDLNGISSSNGSNGQRQSGIRSAIGRPALPARHSLGDGGPALHSLGEGGRLAPQLTQLTQSTHLTSPTSPAFSLCNLHGFWQLEFYGQSTIIKQDQALFYIAWLLAYPFAEPIRGHDLATKVHNLMGDHPDFDHSLPWTCRNGEADRTARLLCNKRKNLEAILDNPDEIEPVKIEALRELIFVLDLQDTYLTDLAGTAAKTAVSLLSIFLRLQADLASATGARGEPHPVLRPFGRHILLYILIPSIRAGVQDSMPAFTYQPPSEISWEIEISGSDT
jgi:hypothetical protein